jgi:hypothetical protein
MPRTMYGVLLLCTQVWFSFPFVADAQQAEQIEWQDERRFFSDADRNAIPALAKVLGLLNPKRVYQGQYLPDLCPYAMVESASSESDHLRTYLQLTVHRKDWKCMRAGTKSKRVGRWLAYKTELDTRREWKIEEDQWVKYVPFGEGVSYDDAELIILAIKHRQLVNQLAGNLQVPTIDPGDITSIQVKANATRTFEVFSSKGGSGEIYSITINDHNVELREVRFWIA